MTVAAVVLRPQMINNKPREAGDFLSLEEYSGIPLHVRDAMESSLDIKTVLDTEAASLFSALQGRIERLEQHCFGE